MARTTLEMTWALYDDKTGGCLKVQPDRGGIDGLVELVEEYPGINPVSITMHHAEARKLAAILIHAADAAQKDELAARLPEPVVHPLDNKGMPAARSVGRTPCFMGTVPRD